MKMVTNPIKIYQPLDFSFFDLKEPSEILKCEPRICTGLPLKCPRTKEGKWLTKTLKATNNQLEDMTEIPEVIAELFGCYDWITWLDLSCNKIASVAPTIKKLSNLKLLYLHGNQIRSLQDVQKLSSLPELSKLTLHGNPVEREKNYFHLVLTVLPNLISLDFTGISRADHETGKALKRGGTRYKKQ
ncbi:Leucine rich repeat containing protein 51 [Paragonimus heterotremus]|uniref:Leucine-rich repeat-containing protein 51 n=1 Tax=Paragonimus heterotremus TaxID=100268 RepID=A0A8J4WPS2_9TREM|nr:Leucine rich repeat containing protein 51 [Paragonimus heterotremus]